MSETYVETPFNMMIVGMTGCGKTYYLLEMIEKEYFRHLEYIFLICPTYFWNKTYQEWKYKDSEGFYPIPCDQNSVDDFSSREMPVLEHSLSQHFLMSCQHFLKIHEHKSI